MNVNRASLAYRVHRHDPQAGARGGLLVYSTDSYKDEGRIGKSWDRVPEPRKTGRATDTLGIT